jgi:ketosteroid isomerase-like protein
MKLDNAFETGYRPFRNSPLYSEKETTMSQAIATHTPEQVLESIVTGINSGNIESLMPLYENEAAFATGPGSLAHGPTGVREALNGFIAMNGELDIQVTRVLEVDDLALVLGVWSFEGAGPEGEPVRLEASNADVLRRQADGTWRFVIDNPWGTD